MSGILHCTLTKYVNSLNEKDTRVEAEEYIISILKSLKVQNVVRLGIRYTAEEAAQVIGGQILDLQLSVNSVEGLLSQIQKQDLTLEVHQDIRTLGINLTIEQTHRSSGCKLFYRYGQLPIYEFRVLYNSATPPEEWAESLLASNEVHVVRMVTNWLRRQSYYGSGDNKYLLCKRDKVLKYPTTNADALLAGLTLRNLCKGVWNKRKMEFDKLEAQMWPWNKSFMRAFDNALINEAGVEKMSELLEAMHFTVDQWFKE